MSKYKAQQKSTPLSGAGAAKGTATIQAEKKAGQIIPYPGLLLAAAVLLVYFPVFSFGFTELDDTIFVKEFRVFNEDIHNLITAFTRGLFDAIKDPYYRPLFSDAMILNYQISGEEPGGYHVVNVMLHLISVLLFYRLGIKLGIAKGHSFLMALIFAVHPVLSQAVAWIPGRNDTMLAVFVLAFFLNMVSYTVDGKGKSFLLSGVTLLLAYFTKETAVFAAPAGFLLLVLYMGKQWNDTRLSRQYGLWVVCFLIWFGARAMATIQSSGIATGDAVNDFIHRLPVILQYIGKVVLPFNLSVFPTQEDTVLYFGIAALVILGIVVFLSLRKDGVHDSENQGGPKAIYASFGVFILFLMPALLVPNALNQQTFEHRLYLPVIGLLLMIPQTVLFRNKLTEKQLILSVVAVCGVFAVINHNHQKSFESPRAFWTQAVETSPNSAFANMSLAARLDTSEFKRSEELFRKAYRINPKEKYLNFYIGELLQKKDSVAASEAYLLTEQRLSDYIRCDFYLARVDMEKRDLAGAIQHLERFLGRDKYNAMANNNLLLIYLDAGQNEKARQQVGRMRSLGMDIPQSIIARLGM